MTNDFVLRIERIDRLAHRIRRLVLKSATGIDLPRYAPGAHIELNAFAGDGRTVLQRSYSLVRPFAQSERYEIAVQLEEQGAGGSRWLHHLNADDIVQASLPCNQFSLHGKLDRPLLLAAGIGITPILCMALSLREEGLSFEMHYVARDIDHAAYALEVERLDGARCWFDGGEPRRGMPLRDVIGPPTAGRHIHVCGPKAFIAAVLATARQFGWAEGQLHWESFASLPAPACDRPFSVELKASGLTLQVPAGKAVLDVMEDAGLDPLFDCRRGDCGVCVAQVLEGQPEHRDICLSEKDKSSGSFCICVSRANSERIVLDL